MSAPKTLNVTEQHQLLDVLLRKDAPHKAFRKGIRNYLIACLMLEAGLRVGEVVKLEMWDLYFKDDPVFNLVIRQLVAKNHVERSIPVSTRLQNSLNEYKKCRTPGVMTKPDHKAFSMSDPYKPITTRQIERIMYSAGLAALNRPVNPHMLRHTFASKLMRVTDMRTVQELLGHTNISTTQIYTHPNEDDKKKAIGNMDGQEGTQ